MNKRYKRSLVGQPPVRYYEYLLLPLLIVFCAYILTVDYIRRKRQRPEMPDSTPGSC